MTISKQNPSSDYNKVLSSATTETMISDKKPVIATKDHKPANESKTKFTFSDDRIKQLVPEERQTLAASDPNTTTRQCRSPPKVCVPSTSSEQCVRTEPTAISVRIDSASPNGSHSSSGHTPSRPTTLSVFSPIPPEFSISPAESLSKASSNEDNVFESSATSMPVYQHQKLCAKQSAPVRPPPSPSTLSVNNGTGSYFWGASSPLALSPSYNSMHSSLASSINDLTVEAEQLERAIRHNDTRHVRRMLELHHKCVNTNADKADSLMDNKSKSSHNLDTDAFDTSDRLVKSQSMHDK